MELDNIMCFDNPVYMDYLLCDGERGRILGVHLIEIGTWIAIFYTTDKTVPPFEANILSSCAFRIEDITSLSYGFMSDLENNDCLEKYYYDLNLKKFVNKRKVFMFKLEICFYKFLGHLICLCPVPSLKDRLLLYAEKRFTPVD